MMSSELKVLFILPYPLNRAPSQRFRVEAFFTLLQKRDIHFKTVEFLDERAWKILYEKGSALQKIEAVIKGFFIRLIVVLFVAYKYNFIFIHREAAPLGPPFFEWLLAKVFRKRIIFDFDDAIWIPTVSESNKLAASVKCFWKIKYICRWSYKIAAGNEYLANFSRIQNPQVVVLPTCVDTEKKYNQIKDQRTYKPIMGWTGSHSTLKYLDALVPVVKRLQQKYDCEFLVICDKDPKLDLLSYRFLPWSAQTEIEDLLKINIGVMPLQQDAWSEGKCGFKIIQYLSLGIPAVASPVGVNKQVVEAGINGFLCSTEQEWEEALGVLLQDAEKRSVFGKAGKKKIEEQYSISANAGKFISLFS